MPSDHFWHHLVVPVQPARLDADRKAKPLTEIVKFGKVGDCHGPWSHMDHLEYRSETGAKIPIA